MVNKKNFHTIGTYWFIKYQGSFKGIQTFCLCIPTFIELCYRLLLSLHSIIAASVSPFLGPCFWHRKFTLKVQNWHFLTHCHQMETQNLVISFDYSWFLGQKPCLCWVPDHEIPLPTLIYFVVLYKFGLWSFKFIFEKSNIKFLRIWKWEIQKRF